MTPEQKKMWRQILDHFDGINMPMTQDLLTEYCNRNKFDAVSLNAYEDALYQDTNDRLMAKLFPEMMQLVVEHMHYIGEFAPDSAHTDESNSRMNLRVRLVQLLEENEVDYHWAEKLLQEFGRMVSSTFESAGNAATNKATQVMLSLANDRFGDRIHMGHVAEYTREVFEKGAKKNEEAEQAE